MNNRKLLHRPTLGVILIVFLLCGYGGMAAQPRSGDWTVSTDFGEFVFTVDSTGTHIIKLSTTFSSFTCGGVTQNGTITTETSPGWPITNSQFTIEKSVNPSGTITMTIDGTFTQMGDEASGTWSVNVSGSICSGSWGASTPCMVTNTDDSGLGSLRDGIDCVTAGDTIYFQASMVEDTITLDSAIIIEKDVIIYAAVGQDIWIVGSSLTPTLSISMGAKVEIINLKISGRNSPNGVVWNQGILNLDNIQIFGAGYPGVIFSNDSVLVLNVGTSITITSPGKVIDIEDNQYLTVQIYEQEWMAENLRTTKYANGDPIPQVTNDSTWSEISHGAWCWYNNDPLYEQPYGKLYNWSAAVDIRNVCPSGWHVPSDEEWEILSDSLGFAAIAGGKMKETGTTHWKSPNTNATNASGFTGVPGGQRNHEGNDFKIGLNGYYWSSTEWIISEAWTRNLNWSNGRLDRSRGSKIAGRSIRCLR